MLRHGAQVVQAYARNKGIISLRQSYRFSVINYLWAVSCLVNKERTERGKGEVNTKHSRKGCSIPPPNLGDGAKSQGVRKHEKSRVAHGYASRWNKR